jgi:hypothetical protein
MRLMISTLLASFSTSPRASEDKKPSPAGI